MVVLGVIKSKFIFMYMSVFCKFNKFMNFKCVLFKVGSDCFIILERFCIV